ncbi:glycosyltransferase, partial [bacterium]|nr:glycosyltransferase [bacterium]
MKKYRIFMVLGGKPTQIARSQMWIRNLADPLVELGHDVFIFDIDDFADTHQVGHMTARAKELLSNELPHIFAKQHSMKNFDIFFSYLHCGQIEPEVIKQIAKNTFTVNFTTNYHQFWMYEEIARIVDVNIYINRIAKEGFDRLGVKSYWMPLAANPKVFRPVNDKTKDVVFIGQPYGIRPYLFWRVLQYGIDLHLYGPGWKTTPAPTSSLSYKSVIRNVFSKLGLHIIKALGTENKLRKLDSEMRSTIISTINAVYPDRVHLSLSDDEYARKVATACIVLNITESRHNHDFLEHKVVFGSNLRDFEATMCRSFLCTQYSTEIEHLFDVDKEICCYHNEHDLAKKVH